MRDAEKRTFKTKAIQTKLNLYIKKYMKKETLQIFLYSLLNIPVCVRVCMRVLTRILWKKTKYWKCPVDYKMYVD